MTEASHLKCTGLLSLETCLGLDGLGTSTEDLMIFQASHISGFQKTVGTDGEYALEFAFGML